MDFINKNFYKINLHEFKMPSPKKTAFVKLIAGIENNLRYILNFGFLCACYHTSFRHEQTGRGKAECQSFLYVSGVLLLCRIPTTKYLLGWFHFFTSYFFQFTCSCQIYKISYFIFCLIHEVYLRKFLVRLEVKSRKYEIHQKSRTLNYPRPALTCARTFYEQCKFLGENKKIDAKKSTGVL